MCFPSPQSFLTWSKISSAGSKIFKWKFDSVHQQQLCAHNFSTFQMLRNTNLSDNKICYLEKKLSRGRAGRELYFNFRDENNNFFLSVMCSRWEQEFLSFSLVFETRTRTTFFQSQVSRRERESRLRQFPGEFSRMQFLTCFWTDIFKKKM